MVIGEWMEKRGIRDQVVIATKVNPLYFSLSNLLGASIHVDIHPTCGEGLARAILDPKRIPRASLADLALMWAGRFPAP